MNEKEIVLQEFQEFINFLHRKNAIKHDGTRFGFFDIRGEFVQRKIRDLEDEFIEFLKEKGYYN